MKGALRLSIVLPLFRNRESIPELISRLAAALGTDGVEIVAVDDGGGDGSGNLLADEATRAGFAATVIRNPANLGQNAAVLTGLSAACGETVVVMDADLQDPPEVVPRLLEALDHTGRDLAFGLREGRWAGTAQILASRIFKGLLFFLLQSELPVRVGLFLAMRRSVLDRIVASARPGEYLVGHLAALRLPAAVVSFPRVPRPGGGSGYSWGTRTGLALSALGWAWRHRPRPFVPAQAVACASAAAILAFILLNGQPFGLQDDGFRYLLSRTWARGSGLFASFDLLYPPGAYTWYGGWMRLLGEQLSVLRLGQALLVGVTVLLVFRPIERHGGLRVAWSAGLLLGVIGTGWGKMAAMGAVAAAVLSLNGARRFGPARFFVLGAGTGLLLGWREDSAVLLGAVTVVSLLLARRGPRSWLAAGSGAAAGFGLWLAIFAADGELGPFLAHEGHRLWLLVDRLTPTGRTVASWPVPDRIASPRDLLTAGLGVLKLVPLLGYLGLLVGYLVSRRRSRPWPVITMLAALLGLAYTPQFLWEYPDLYHFRSHLAVFVIAMAAALGALRRPRRAALAGVLVAAAATGFAAIAWQHATTTTVPYPAEPARSLGIRLAGSVPPWAGLPFEPGQTLIALPWCPGWYAVETVPPGTRCLSGLHRHLRQRDTLHRIEQDLACPTNRYVIVKGSLGALAPPLARRIDATYAAAGRWNGYRLYERRLAPR